MLPFRMRPAVSERVSELMQGAAACFPHTDLSDVTASEWLKIWIDFADKYGFARLMSAVNRLKFKLDFFPKPSEVQREIDASIQEERVSAKAGHTKFVSCGKCSIDGYVCVNASGKAWDGNPREDRFAKECECRTAWRQQAKNRVDE